jgi:hypothetical protein
MPGGDCATNWAATHGQDCISLRPHHLLCLFCLKGGGEPPDRAAWQLDEALRRMAANRNLMVTLETAYDCMGGPTNQPERYDPATRRKDLQVLQQLNLSPGDTRPAHWLLRDYVPKLLPTLWNICDLGGETGPAWQECPECRTGAYAKGIKDGVIPLRTAEEMECSKQESCAELASADRLRIRPHHLLCIMCFWGTATDAPIPGDNLWEPLIRMRDNPELEVELVEGACMVCPPCHGWDPERNICDTLCGLRDRLKDLNTLQKLGLAPGEVRTARELYDLIWERITDIRHICANMNTTPLEWHDCGGTRDGRHGRARTRGKFITG